MIKIAKSLFVVFALVAISASATSSYFTDQKTVAGNTFTAGGVHLDIRGAGATPRTLANMAPGQWTAPVEYDVYNLANSLPVKYRFTDNKVSESMVGYYDKINVRVRHTFAGTPNPAAWPVIYSGPLKDLMIDSTLTSGIISSSLGTNITHVFYLEYQLDPGTGNTFQSATATADLIFSATQVNNPGWTE